MGRIVTLGALCVWIIALAGCTGNALTPGSAPKSKTSTASLVGQKDGNLTVVASLPPPKNVRDGRSTLISPDDLLQIDVFQVKDLSRETRVNANGLISMPLIGATKAGGMTAADLERSLEKKYGRNYIQNPDITVLVKESPTQRITMDGEFLKPGVLPVTGKTSLIQSVAQAGGLTPVGDDTQVYVFRQYKDGGRVAKYSLKEIRGGLTRDPRLYGGDVVVAFTSNSKVAARNLREALGVARSAASIATPF